MKNSDITNESKHVEWLRFIARIFDEFITFLPFMLLGDFINIFMFGTDERVSKVFSIVGRVIGYFFSSFVEAFCLSVFGSTPGKWLMGLTVKNIDGVNLTFREALLRNWKLRFEGLGLGVGIFVIICLGLKRHEYMNEGIVSWDKKDDKPYVVITSHKVSIWKKVICVLSLLILFFIALLGIYHSIKQKINQ